LGVVAGNGAGDAAALWTVKDGSLWGLRITVYDATAPEARDVGVPAGATAGVPASFSVTPWDALTTAHATWDFGDGTTATGATAQHAYATAGPRTVTITVVDDGGNTTTTTRTIAVAAAAPPAPPAAPAPAPPAKTPAAGPKPAAPGPALSRVKLTRASFAVGPLATPLTGKARAAAAAKKKPRRGTAVQWRLSAPATVKITIATVPKHGKRARTIGTLTRTAPAGASQLAFSGRLGRRALTPGAYRLTLTATDAAGRAAKPVTLRFKVVRAG
jgi:hypothetical protein